jgi:putative ABC transport system substrate-binding protein
MAVLPLIFSVWPRTIKAGKAFRILIVATSHEEPYRLAIEGFKSQLSASYPIDFTEIYHNETANTGAALEKSIKTQKPDLIFSLGGEATDTALKTTSSIPIVATMILKNAYFKQAQNVTGVYLNYPLSIQFQWLKKFFPDQKKIAIFFNHEENANTIQEALKLAKQQGLELMPIAVESPKELPSALDRLKNNVEVLLAIPDEVAMSAKTVKEVLLASFRNRVPLIGLSDNWVKSGALYALSWDYEDLGRQCALQSDKLLKGANVQSIPLEYPRKTAYSINVKIAEHMNMDISDTLLKQAKFIFD